jgi:hypothetical protein
LWITRREPVTPRAFGPHTAAQRPLRAPCRRRTGGRQAVGRGEAEPPAIALGGEPRRGSVTSTAHVNNAGADWPRYAAALATETLTSPPE